MAADIPLRCECGALEGSLRGVTPRRGNRCICYCDDCQSFAHFLDGRRPVLDVHGGTDIFQTSPARVTLSKGAEHLACLRLRPGGLLRWYASCCRTPIGNTLATRQVPFVGLVLACVDPASREAAEPALGPVRGRVNARFAKRRAELDAPDRTPLSAVVRFVPVILGARLRGAHRRSPFFEPATGEPTVSPKVLSAEELARVEAARDAA